ncbi:Conserved hypothetical protein [Candidatus Protochlamydia naegleriophila]|uniref:Serine aminopeptidase S33 domain-containing protein n=1 Tax=Candidatus Protochlamydia naegleriophila TaxID=389348 RepID=A0A0U5ET34_9BACT|nr:alpha/beta hydrolase [Candidatus Protochlamydia naegleriophila]CUI17379.1 Conserved hypothetical protein [Candidatus Protochlamydia naegleriophila]
MNLNRLGNTAHHLQAVARYSGDTRFDAARAHRSVQIAIRILDQAFLGRPWNPVRDRQALAAIKQSIETIKQNQNGFFQSSDLSLLEEKVEMVFQYGMIKTVFNAQATHSSLAKNLIAPFNYLCSLVTKRFADFIRKEVYRGWSEKVKNADIKQIVEQEYIAKYNNWYQREMEQADTQDRRNHVQDILADEMAQLQNQVNNNARVQAVQQLERKAEETRELFAAIGGERIQLKTSDGVKLDATYLSCNEFKLALNAQNGQKVSFGFENGTFSGISLDPDNEQVNQCLIAKLYQLGLLASLHKPGSGYGLLYDGIHGKYVIVSKEELQNWSRRQALNFDSNLQAYVFAREPLASAYAPIPTSDDEWQRIQQWGGRKQEICIKGEKMPVPAFSTLPALRHNPDGYVSLKIPNGAGHFSRATYYIDQDKAEELVRAGVLKKVGAAYHWTRVDDISAREPRNSHNWKIKNNGVAILSSGNAGVYEMHKAEALSLLMNGCDLMMLNLRGYGGSEGEPSVQGNYCDLEAAYQFIKHRSPGIPDAKIAAWALCLSGGVAAHLVEQHPWMNLFLNQTYAEFWNILKEMLDEEVEKFLRKYIYREEEQSKLRQVIKTCLLPLISAAVRLVAPNYNVKNRLSKIKGQVCIMQATDDSLMTAEETKQMRDAIGGARTNHRFVDIPGEHCTPWNQVVIYHNRQGREVSESDYSWISFDGTHSIFIPNHALDSNRSWHLTAANGRTCSFSPDPQDPSKVIAEFDQNGTITRMQLARNKISEEVIPQFIVNLDLTPEYRGHDHVKQFLSDARMGSPII